MCMATPRRTDELRLTYAHAERLESAQAVWPLFIVSIKVTLWEDMSNIIMCRLLCRPLVLSVCLNWHKRQAAFQLCAKPTAGYFCTGSAWFRVSRKWVGGRSKKNRPFVFIVLLSTVEPLSSSQLARLCARNCQDKLNRKLVSFPCGQSCQGR